jgi:hypothetical protein
MTNAGYDFIWTEMQRNSRDWNAVARVWRACPHAKAVPGVDIAHDFSMACHSLVSSRRDNVTITRSAFEEDQRSHQRPVQSYDAVISSTCDRTL